MQNYLRKLNCVQCMHQTQCYFNGLSDAEYKFLNTHKKEVDFRAGETIYKQGTESKYLVFLLSGMAKVYVEGGNNKNVPRLIKHFNHTQNRYSTRLINVIYKNMEARIADALLYLVNEVYFSREFTLTISRSDLADLAGMSRESTSRILGQFKEQEILVVKGRKVEILNKKQLEQIARLG